MMERGGDAPAVVSVVVVRAAVTTPRATFSDSSVGHVHTLLYTDTDANVVDV